MEATTDVLKVIDQLQTERDQLRERVAQLEAECKRVNAERSMLLHALADEKFTEEELDRSSREPGGCSLAEFWARLEKP